MKLSAFGNKFGASSGIQILMDDIGDALASGRDMIMMGGGNPAAIPAVEDLFQARMAQLAQDPQQLGQMLGSYDPPQGNATLIKDLASLFRKQLGWQVSEKNIALTNVANLASLCCSICLLVTLLMAAVNRYNCLLHQNILDIAMLV